MFTLIRRTAHKSGDIFEWSIVRKSQFIYSSTIQLAFLIGAVLIAIEHFGLLPDHDLDSRGALQLATLTLVYGLVAITMYLIGHHVAKREPDCVWYAHISIQLYCIANIIILYYIGLYSIGTGVALGGGPIAGMILFPPKIVFMGMFTGILAAIFLIALTAMEFIPYAPLLLDPGSAHHNLAWLIIVTILVAPHVILVVGVATLSILRWTEREQRVQYLSCTDVLTNVANRRHLMDMFDVEMERATRESKPLSLMMVDLDHFKRVNDTFGHQSGDEVIKTAASVLIECTRKVDYVGRYGGEEFAIVLPNANADDASVIAERCRQSMAASEVYAADGSQIKLTASIGVATFIPTKEHITDISTLMETLLRQADSALYEAKEGGRNRVIAFHKYAS